MRIWVDADACPAVIKEILYRAAERNQIHLALVANKALHTPRRRGSTWSRWLVASMSQMVTSSTPWNRAIW